jgi:maleate isomerase
MNDTATLEQSTYTVLPFTMDEGVMARAAIGLVVLATDQTLEHEWRQIIDLPGVAFFESRMYNSPDISPATLAATSPPPWS